MTRVARWGSVVALLLLLAALLAFAALASAAFPGTDGRLAYTIPVRSGAGISYRLETAYAVIRGVHTPAGVSLSETAVDRGGDSFDPAWAADGRTLAFASTRGGSPQIYLFQLSLTGGVVPLCGLEVCQLTHDPGGDYAPVFSPNQQRIAYTGISGGRPQIFTMTASGGGVRALTSEGANQEPAWSPAGIAFASNRGGRFQLYLMNAEGGEVRQLTNQSASNIQPAFSPNGGEIAYTHCEGNRSQVFLLNLAGGAPRQLTRSSPENSLPAFSPDGAAIVLTHGPSPPAEPSGALTALTAQAAPPLCSSPAREWVFDQEAIDAHSGAPLGLGVPAVGFNGDWAPLPVPPAGSAAAPPVGTAIAQPISGQVTVSPGHTAAPSLAPAGAPLSSGSTLHNRVEVPANSTYNATRGAVRLILATTVPAGRPPRRGSPAHGSPPPGSPPPPPDTAPHPVPTSGVTEAVVAGGRFSVLQKTSAAVPVIRLLGRPTRCTGARGTLARAIHRPRVQLHTRGLAYGRGAHGRAYTNSTVWEMEETCRGTVYRSIHDPVFVTDPVRRRTIVLTSGHHYLVRP
jgi:hypothetical protein